jgi:ankyrin repeat protein
MRVDPQWSKGMTRSLFEMPEGDLVQALAAGACPNQSMGAGVSLLHQRARNGEAQAVAALLEAGANIDGRTGFNCDTPLHLATYPEVIRLLVDAGLPVDSTDGCGRTGLHRVVGEHGSLEAAEAFLACGANPNAADRNKLSPLHLAQTKDLADLLLDAGADPHALDSFGLATYNSFKRDTGGDDDRTQEVNLHIWGWVLAKEAEEERLLMEASTARACAPSRVGARL